MKCAICGRKEMNLVYSSIYTGAVCVDCYDKAKAKTKWASEMIAYEQHENGCVTVIWKGVEKNGVYKMKCPNSRIAMEFAKQLIDNFYEF